MIKKASMTLQAVKKAIESKVPREVLNRLAPLTILTSFEVKF